jgi:hypothetical protein
VAVGGSRNWVLEGSTPATIVHNVEMWITMRGTTDIPELSLILPLTPLLECPIFPSELANDLPYRGIPGQPALSRSARNFNCKSSLSTCDELNKMHSGTRYILTAETSDGSQSTLEMPCVMPSTICIAMRLCPDRFSCMPETFLLGFRPAYLWLSRSKLQLRRKPQGSHRNLLVIFSLALSLP